METHRRQPPSSSAANPNHHHHHQQQHFTNIQQHMFEKPLTPSDVGKLNRLVIPKQHAEKHFPMGGAGGGGVDQQKGLLLTFEDESGKLWRFRYSYWNSSQSYVLTKGWSRFVKEKRLDAGDVVLFRRDLVDGERMFIGWRRRLVTVDQDRVAAAASGGGGGAHVSEVVYDARSGYPAHHLMQPGDIHLNAEEIYENADSYRREVVSTRRLRLFGVNLECQDNSESSNTHVSSHGDQSGREYNFNFNDLHHNTVSYIFMFIYTFVYKLIPSLSYEN
ncbi:hypothetical protein SSX86_009139 [Deinandra increscens subsp. villosa]|uniref:TF-B3 domain-containing protein n=1 Tax=Deinandra increscens subsp. villosa TaxID=3103831 RepID=A0AAP0H4M0_9ASTR